MGDWSKRWKEMREYGIIKRYKKGVFMDISEIRQKFDANRSKNQVLSSCFPRWQSLLLDLQGQRDPLKEANFSRFASIF